jgi:hypothetical protein
MGVAVVVGSFRLVLDACIAFWRTVTAISRQSTAPLADTVVTVAA